MPGRKFSIVEKKFVLASAALSQKQKQSSVFCPHGHMVARLASIISDDPPLKVTLHVTNTINLFLRILDFFKVFSLQALGVPDDIPPILVISLHLTQIHASLSPSCAPAGERRHAGLDPPSRTHIFGTLVLAVLLTHTKGETVCV